MTAWAPSAGHRHDADLDAARLQLARHVARAHDGHAVHAAPDLGRVVVEDHRDAESLAAEAPVVEEGRAEVPESHQGQRPLAVEPQDARELRLETRHVIPDPAHAELAEVGEVLPDLGGVQSEALGQILGGDGLDPVLLELLEAPRVHRQTPDRHLGDLAEPVPRTRRHGAVHRPPGAGGGAPGGAGSPT